MFRKIVGYAVLLALIWIAVSIARPYWHKYWIGQDIEAAAIFGTKKSVGDTRGFLTRKMKEAGRSFTGDDFKIFELEDSLVQRHIRANKKRQAQEEIRRFDSSEAILKFEDLENRIERMEAEADLVNFGKKPAVDAEWESLLVDDEIEKELQTLKSSLKKEDEGASSTS